MTDLSTVVQANNLSIEFSKQGTDKGYFHSYTDLFYQPLFELCSKKPESIFEIGIQYKASLALWKLYFPLSKVSGCDIDIHQETHPLAARMITENEISVFEGDAYSDKSIIPDETDLIIDDGPHTIESQLMILSFREKLSKNGLLVIEDIGDIGGPIYCFKKLLDSLPKSERRKCLCLDYSRNKGRWDDAVFVYSNDPEVLKKLSKRLAKFHIHNSRVGTYYVAASLYAKISSLRKKLGVKIFS